jgi:hypothetical protein
MIPFLFIVLDETIPILMPVERTPDIEAMAHGFMDRGGRYLVTEYTMEYIRIAAVVAGKDDSIHELTSEIAKRGTAVAMIDRLICDSVRLTLPVH